MSIPLEVWDKFREEMEPYIEKAYKKVISFKEFNHILDQKMKEYHEKYDNQKTVVGWIGGGYEDFGLYDSKEAAERGYLPTTAFQEIVDDKFKGRKVKITFEIIE